MNVKTYKVWGIIGIILSVLGIIDGLLNKHYLILVFMVPQILITLYNVKNYEKKNN